MQDAHYEKNLWMFWQPTFSQTQSAKHHGIYDIQQNEGFMEVGVSHETAEFASTAIRRWLLEIGSVQYKNCSCLLIQADAGGANACDRWLWKVELQRLADEF